MGFRFGVLESMVIKLSKSSIGGEEKKAVVEVLDKEYLGMGEDVKEFESLLQDFFGRHVVCVVNGTAALHLALQGCGIGVGDEVLVPSLTYVASFQAISATGAKPVACDVSIKTLSLDFNDVENRITKNTKAIMPVHFTGSVGDLEQIYNIAEKYNLRVIEDAAHAFGSIHKSKLVGSFGDIACFSFDGIKNITSGEGGCIVSDDPVFIKLVKDARLLGVHNDSENRYTGKRTWSFDVTHQGWRYHMSNIMAAIGIQQFRKLEKFKLIRQSHAKLYDSLLNDNPKLKTLQNDYSAILPHIYVVRVLGMNEESRSHLRARLWDAGIETGHHYQLNHNLSFFKDSSIISLHNSEQLSSELITLPLHIDLTESDIRYVSAKLQEYL